MDPQHDLHPPTFTRRLRPLRGHMLALVVLLAAVATVFAIWRVAYDRELRAAEARFVSQTEAIADLIHQRLVNYELVAGGGISLFASVARPTPQQWYGYVEGMELQRRFPGMVGLGFAGYLRHSRIEELEHEWEQAGWGALDLRPDGDREVYGPILYLEPQTPENLAAIGFDMFSEPTRRAAMTGAMERGQPTLTGPVQLIQDSGERRVGLLLYVPVYRDGHRTTAEQRRESMIGWVYLPFRVDAFVNDALGGAPVGHRFRMLDVTGGTPDLLYASPATADTASPAFRHAVELPVDDRLWRLEFDSPPLSAAAPRLRALQSTLALGLFASLLMYAVAWMLARTESRAHNIALRMTEDYRRSELRFRTAMQYSAIGKVLLDSHGDVVEANPAFAEIVGLTPGSLVGARFEHLFEDDESTTRAKHRDDAQGVHRETRRLHRKGGQPRHVQLTYAPVPGSVGQDIAGLVQAEDVTERLQAEAKVHALNRTLEARVAVRTRELSEANQELESFAYTVSHDLRAPLRAIDGFSRILVERYGERLDASGRDYLGRVRNAANRMGELIDAMLKMSRLSRSPVRREAVDLSRMAAEVVEELRAGEPQHAVDVVIQPGMEVLGDAALMRNLLGNLLGNAWKFSHDAAAPRIEVGREGQEFYVRDNGAGFNQVYVDKLFRPFQRLHDQKVFAGHGIGLASVKRIVQRHGGSIRAEGREGEGATFWFTLPEPAATG